MAPPFDLSSAASPGAGAFGLVATREEALVHVLPVPFDATCSFRQGAAQGPEAIRAASRQIDLFDLRTGRPFEAGIWMAPSAPEVEAWNREARRLAIPVIEAGGPGQDAALLEAARQVDAVQARLDTWVAGAASDAIDAGHLLAVVGGDHSVPCGSIQAHAEHFPGLGLVQFDAHADLRPGYEGFPRSHASILSNVSRRIPNIERILQIGVRDLCEEEFQLIDGTRIRAVFDHDWANARLEGRNLRSLIRRELTGLPREIYITFDIDGLDPSLCPHTGTPVPGGLQFDEAMAWLEEIVLSGRRIVGFDLCEVAPDPSVDPGTGWDEIVGARVLYRLIGYALASRQDS